MRTALAVALALCACATSHKLDVQTDTALRAETHDKASGERKEGPWTLTTTTEEYGPPSADRPESPSEPGIALKIGVSGRTSRPAVVKRTVTVETHAPITEAWRSSSDGLAGAEETLRVKAEDKSAPSAGCMLGLGFYGAIALAALCGGLGLWLRLRR